MAIKSSLPILLIDDSSSVRQNLKFLLQQMGLKKFFSAKNTEEASQVLDQEDIGLIICELKIPKGSGYDVFLLAKEKTIPFVLMTEDSRQEVISKATELGIDSVLVKPFTQQSLTSSVLKLFS